jgi:MerR family transcriptional regulator, light-induced transcriptional regulator
LAISFLIELFTVPFVILVMNDFTIKDLENLSGIKAHTIRIWEQRYNFLKPKRTDTNIRFYSNEELKTLLNIALLNKYGVKLCHIDQMCHQEICSKVLSLNDKEAVQERAVIDLVRNMIDLKTDKFEEIINRNVREKGIEVTVKEIIFPFLDRIGILWQTGHIMPAQEHFVSNIIRQKLIVAIDSIETHPVETSKALLFIPEGEHHELGLLFLCYLVKRKGMNVVYLGANVPMSDVQSVIEMTHPKMAFIHLTSACPNFNFDRLIHNIPKYMGDLPTVISGYPTHKYHKELPPSVSFKKSLTEITNFISEL